VEVRRPRVRSAGPEPPQRHRSLAPRSHRFPFTYNSSRCTLNSRAHSLRWPFDQSRIKVPRAPAPVLTTWRARQDRSGVFIGSQEDGGRAP
jgi:hypothetical protein